MLMRKRRQAFAYFNERLGFHLETRQRIILMGIQPQRHHHGTRLITLQVIN